MSTFNYAQNSNCSICGKRLGFGADHSACSRKKQQLHRAALKNPAKVREMYPTFFLHEVAK